MRKDLFTSATLKLTAWYLLLLMLVSLLFSIVLFSISSSELRRGLRSPDGPPGFSQLFMDTEYARALRQARVEEGTQRLLGNLVTFNIVTTTFGGIASYLLARRTLRPIKDVLDAQSRFSSDAAHELRTPLAVMQSEIEVDLRDKKGSKASHRATLVSTLDEVHRLRTLTDRLLLLASSQDLPKESIQVEELAIDAVNRAIPLAQEKHISIENTVAPATIHANEESIVDVLTILIDNAIKYSPKKSTVVVSSTQSDRSVSISVKDSGIGIDEAEHSRVFDRFYRADLSRSKENVEGHGLGLSIAKRIIELHGGNITLESQLEQGSTFTIKLPKN